MSTRPTDSSTSFTYAPLTARGVLGLAFATARTFCKEAQPSECKKTPQEGDLRQRCQQVFEECIENAERFERWHRSS